MASTPRLLLALLLTLPLVACQKAKDNPAGQSAGGGGAAGPMPTAKNPAGDYDLDSKDILARTETAPSVDVKHVLIGWKELGAAYGGAMDARAKDRTNEEAAKLAWDIYGQLKKAPDQIDDLIKKHSEDPGSQSGKPYTITEAARFVPEFKKLGLRLKVKEVGIVRTDYGYHVIERVEGAPPPPPETPDPLESADILARPADPGTVHVQHVLIGWKDVPAAKQRPLDPRAAARSKEEADKLATETLAKVRGGADMAALMKELSEDKGSAQTGRTYEVNAGAGLVPPFKNLSLRLQLGEAGMVKTMFGWHIIKRVPPPPPDNLDSVDVLGRQPVTQKAKVKHILLGWTEANAGDPRGAKRTRAELEDLVKKTIARLKKGEKIEALMKELSEDPGSAASGEGYDVDPTAGLVQPFKDLSLRLNVKEIGAVKTQFGIHIIQRVE